LNLAPAITVVLTVAISKTARVKSAPLASALSRSVLLKSAPVALTS
jgi:hypothetical protein